MENSPKDCFVNIRVTEEQKARLVKEAEAKKLTVSKLANKLFDKHFEEKAPKVIPAQIQPLIEEKPKDTKPMVIIASIVGGVVLFWLIFTRSPRKNEFEKMPHKS
ncbi:hypothetical protein EGI22_16170 [Lacihabitans sp. LS3-19]|uniref:hypothetical protein n=1 Tax=Lacihabitans sp. LS3-19 TaxID=2487335 RepID=UPI0020CF07FD|nr:hypothetical protein [Lacihabitans sp. LS3-19]MCP9769440.1 hypothetical protein [Lacihabitans sp. LS3-19]